MKRTSVLPTRTGSGTSWVFTRVTFVGNAIFGLALVAWWLIFQSLYVGTMSRDQSASWYRDVVTATLLARSKGDVETEPRRTGHLPSYGPPWWHTPVTEGV